MEASVDFTLAFEEPDEAGWIVARVLEVPGAISQGPTREQARENVLDALRTVLTPDDELTGEQPRADLEHHARPRQPALTARLLSTDDSRVDGGPRNRARRS